MVNSDHLLRGLEVFVIGFGGVFVILLLVALATASLGWLLPREDAKNDAPPG